MFTHPQTYDVLVVGGGHAGIEAALATSRMGCRTLLTSMDLDTLGKMSCNPAIGGLAKGHMVREIDALGGQMALTTDATGIQFRMLNRRKGPAVWAPRAQCDKKSYQFAMKSLCERQPLLETRQAQVFALVVQNDQVCGIDTSLGVRFLGRCVILTTGTFLRGLMHIGEHQQTGGRGGEQAAQGLSANLKMLGFTLQRLKTGTPPRLNRHSICWKKLQEQAGDTPPPSFSFEHEASYFDASKTPTFPRRENDPSGASFSIEPSPHPMFHVEQSCESFWSPPLRQLSCYLTSTSLRTGDIIRANLHRSPMYCGQIEGVGPRYCPSIEDKFVKFPDKATHQIFLEPEGLDTDEIYVNGCSTSLPYDVQLEILHSIQGLEQAVMTRAGYAVEYDFASPTQLYSWLETKRIQNLFFAGQLNGTTGYEEAAAQGFVAGVNAALRIQGKPPYLFSRSESYLGVLVDDLVTKGTQEPYRMFTSRAEYRLLLRQDNADARLTRLGYEWGLISKERYRRFEAKMQRLNLTLQTLRAQRLEGISLEQWLKRPEIDLYALEARLPGLLSGLPEDLRASVEMDIKYEGYVARDLAQVEKMKKIEEQRIPADLNYQDIKALRRETREKLQAARPATLGQANRISGVTPTDIGILQIWLKKRQNR